MSHRIACYTLFDITHTGIANRSKPQDANIDDWMNKRNTQCNFDTILQVVSLRSQPDVVKLPIRFKATEHDYDKFGFLYPKTEQQWFYWRFEFEVQHASVFENDNGSLGALYRDCEGVPMLLCKEKHDFCPNFLNTTEELRNIYFEVV